ncbi:MAG: thiamine-phosphate kinase [Dehalococcoidales bacterium]|nr:thiamine-phosphate kinase [Dehalococcoidales bacterium]
MKISELGEFGLIDILTDLTKECKQESNRNILIDSGDDAAAWQNDSAVNMVTVDCLVQGVHFKLDKISWRELGWKALAISLSDIAAMGGNPKYALFSLALPGETDVDNVIDLYKGILELGCRYNVKVIGGNISKAPLVFIDSIVYGAANSPDIMLSRSAAKPGDEIAVTGYLGAAAGGLKIVKSDLPLSGEIKDTLLRAINKPLPRIEEGQKLAAGGVKCAMDISDGLVADLGHICQASHIEAVINIDAVPVHPAVKTAFGNDALDMALSGGEDYELLFTAGHYIIENIKKQFDCPVTVIGKIVAGDNYRVKLLDRSDNTYLPSDKGWNHFGK